MRFIRNLKIAAQAFKLYRLQSHRAKLSAKLNEIKAEEEGVARYLRAQMKGESFQFADPSGWLMQVDINPRRRMDMDEAAVREHYAEVGEEVPRKAVKWVEVKVHYVE